MRWLRMTLALAAIAGLAWAARRFSWPDCEELRAETFGHVITSSAAFVVACAVSTVLLVPGSLLGALGGVLFGPLLGTGLVTVGCLLGAIGSFGIGRYFAHDFIERWLRGRRWYRYLQSAPKAHRW